MKNIEHREEYLKYPLKSINKKCVFHKILSKSQNLTPPVADRGWGTPLSAFSKRLLIFSARGVTPYQQQAVLISINQDVQKDS